MSALRVGDVFRSNEGRGPLLARIVCLEGQRIRLERWQEGRSTAVQFVLSPKYFESPRCGWKKHTRPIPSASNTQLGVDSMKRFLFLLVPLLLFGAVGAQTGKSPPTLAGHVQVIDDTVGTLPLVLDGPGMNTVTSIGRADSTMHSVWRGAGNVTHSVSTPRQQGETVTSQAMRHGQAVNALQIVFPPVPAGS